MITHYIELIKPKIILGNIISIIGGFLLASHGEINYSLLIKILISISLIIAGNCMLNNVIDYDLDSLMERTKNRTLIIDLITKKHVIIHATILLILGMSVLIFSTNLQVIFLTIISSIVYLGIYTALMKQKTMYSTLIGSVSGAAPPIIGYCSVTNFDIGALILIILFILWQIPHSYSIFILRFEDYESASIPTFPLKMGIKASKRHIIYYIISFMIGLTTLVLEKYASYLFLIPMELLSGIWLYSALCIENKSIIKNDTLKIQKWSKKIFIMSIAIMIFFNITIIIDSLYN